MFSLFRRPDVHLKRVTELLRDAQINRVEHQAAAEHHSALALMYAQRAERLEAELRGSLPELLGAAAPCCNEAMVEIEAQANPAPARPRLSSL